MSIKPNWPGSAWRWMLIVALLAGTSLVGSTAAQAAPASGTQIRAAAATNCPSGYSCYYDGHDATTKIWTAPSCGWFDLGSFSPPLNDRISSIVNYGGGQVDAYNWSGGTYGYWIWVGYVPVGWETDFVGGADNVIDAVDIAC